MTTGPSNLPPADPTGPDDVARYSLDAMSDGVATADANGNVTFLNAAAQFFTGRSQQSAYGVPFDEVVVLIDEVNRRPIRNFSPRPPLDDAKASRSPRALLVARDGQERVVEDRSSPVCNAAGETIGRVFVFRDATEQSRREQELRDALSYASDILATLREPFVVLDKELRVKTANAAFYRTFLVTDTETENQSLFTLGNGQWMNPALKDLLIRLLDGERNEANFELTHDFPTIGRKVMVLNARCFAARDRGTSLILLGIEDATERRRTEALLRLNESAWKKSEIQYRRLFESARDGILILDANSGKIVDANPYMSELLGYEYSHFIGKELWEIGLFKDIAANQAAVRELQREGYIRYDHLPLETRDKRRVEVEVVSNAYEADKRLVIQCNIRDCSERVRLENEVRASLAEKEVLLKEVHHRVKNNLQVISSLLHLQSQQVHDPAAIQMFRNSQNRVRSMALVHDRLYRSRDLTQVDFAGYVESLAGHLFSAYRVDVDRIALEVNVEDISLPIDAAIPCGLILNELISNCLKHAFAPDVQGVIRIELIAVSKRELTLSVSDDGVGLPTDVDPQRGETFGMQLIGDLTAQLHGRLEVRREAGTAVCITFPQVESLPYSGKGPT